MPIEKRQSELDAHVDGEHAKEHVMIHWIYADARSFYKNQENLRAFEAWKNIKEEMKNANHINP